MRNLFAILLIITLLLPVSGCGSAALLSDFSVTPDTIRPNERPPKEDLKLQRSTTINYRLNQRSDVKITLFNAAGEAYVLRDKLTRQADTYSIEFRGAIASGTNKEEQRVLPDGDYRVLIEVFPAESLPDTQPNASQEARLTIRDANTTPPVIEQVVVEKKLITPNGDAEDDETRIGYTIVTPVVATSTLAYSPTVTIHAINSQTQKVYLLQEPKRQAGVNGIRFNGSELGGNLMPDGDYFIRIRTEDRSGNVSIASEQVTLDKGGSPQLYLAKADIQPRIVTCGGVVTITAIVRNEGNAPIKSWGPPSKQLFDTNETFSKERMWENGAEVARYYERPGRWRLAVTWTNAGSKFPLRWGLIEGTENEYKDFQLLPGDERTIIAPIRVYEPTENLYFTVALERGGVGFIGERPLPPVSVSGCRR